MKPIKQLPAGIRLLPFPLDRRMSIECWRREARRFRRVWGIVTATAALFLRYRKDTVMSTTTAVRLRDVQKILTADGEIVLTIRDSGAPADEQIHELHLIGDSEGRIAQRDNGAHQYRWGFRFATYSIGTVRALAYVSRPGELKRHLARLRARGLEIIGVR